MLPIEQLTCANIDARIIGLNMLQLQDLWQQLIDVRMSMPPNARFFELKDMLENHVVPVFQAHQGIDVVAFRAHNYVQGQNNGYAPLEPAVAMMVESVLSSKGLMALGNHSSDDFMAAALPPSPAVVGNIAVPEVTGKVIPEVDRSIDLASAIQHSLQKDGLVATRAKINKIFNDIL